VYIKHSRVALGGYEGYKTVDMVDRSVHIYTTQGASSQTFSRRQIALLTYAFKYTWMILFLSHPSWE